MHLQIVSDKFDVNFLRSASNRVFNNACIYHFHQETRLNFSKKAIV